LAVLMIATDSSVW